MNDFFNKILVKTSELYNKITGKNEINPIFSGEDPQEHGNSESLESSRGDDIMKGMQFPRENEPESQLENTREQDVFPREAGEILKGLKIESSIAGDQISAPNTPSEPSAGRSINL